MGIESHEEHGVEIHKVDLSTLPLDQNEWTDEEFKAAKTAGLKQREADLRGHAAESEAKLDETADGHREIQEVWIKEDKDNADRLADVARKTIANIDSDRQARVDVARSQNRVDQTEYNPDLAHLRAKVTDQEETALAKERRKRSPNEVKIRELTDMRDRVDRQALSAYDQTPFARAKDIRDDEPKSLWRRIRGK